MEIENLKDVAEILESLLDDLSFKSKEELKQIISELRSENFTFEDIIRIQDELEGFLNSNNVDSFARNEIMNIISDLELLIQN
jgi:uncharacterized protein (UPF0147 family)